MLSETGSQGGASAASEHFCDPLVSCPCVQRTDRVLRFRHIQPGVCTRTHGAAPRHKFFRRAAHNDLLLIPHSLTCFS